jgi:hypothetical protein
MYGFAFCPNAARELRVQVRKQQKSASERSEAAEVHPGQQRFTKQWRVNRWLPDL